MVLTDLGRCVMQHAADEHPRKGMASVFWPMRSRCGALCCAVLHVRPSCSAKDDFIYAEEMQQYEKSGVLSQLHVAFSRDGASKVLVLLLPQARCACTAT